MKPKASPINLGKTVYILGAGFSIGAGAPSQEGLVKRIFQISAESPHEFKVGSVEEFKSFLTDTLQIPDEIHDSVPLEDIFTPLDKCVNDNISFRNLNAERSAEFRALIYYLVGKTLEIVLRNSEKNYIDKFASELVSKCSHRANHRYKDIDSVSVISTNWDILLDTSLQRIIDDNHYKKAVIDYCCHISSNGLADDRVKPGLEILGLGGFNVKLLKLHGSLNWLQCPRCLRVYVDVDNKISISQYVERSTCRHCDRNFGKMDSHILVSNLIMPTFLKNLLNPQYKLIWQNAGIELAEAEELIFIGYSLPQADFEFRQLLSRMV
jgi:hypothetical protein